MVIVYTETKTRMPMIDGTYINHELHPFKPFAPITDLDVHMFYQMVCWDRPIMPFTYLRRTTADKIAVMAFDNMDVISEFLINDYDRGLLQLPTFKDCNAKDGLIKVLQFYILQGKAVVIYNDLFDESDTYGSYQISHIDTVRFNNKIINKRIERFRTINKNKSNSSKPQTTKKIKNKVECCICLDECVCVWECKVCNRGTICKGCKTNMKGVKSCPVCRSVPKKNKK